MPGLTTATASTVPPQVHIHDNTNTHTRAHHARTKAHTRTAHMHSAWCTQYNGTKNMARTRRHVHLASCGQRTETLHAHNNCTRLAPQRTIIARVTARADVLHAEPVLACLHKHVVHAVRSTLAGAQAACRVRSPGGMFVCHCVSRFATA